MIQMSSSNSPDNGGVVLFTLGTFAVGLVSYLYLRSVSMVNEVKVDNNTIYDTVNTINENVNNMFIRTETMATKEELAKKADINPDDAIEEGKYQAWIGKAESEEATIQFTIIRDKIGSYKSNKEWIAWTGEKNASVVVRDFYVSTFESDYDWILDFDNDTARLTETMVNGWRSTIRIDVEIKYKNGVKSKDESTEYLKKHHSANSFTWVRALVNSS